MGIIKVIEENSLSLAWAKTFLHIYNNPHNNSLLITSVNEFIDNMPIEDERILSFLKESYEFNGKDSTKTVSCTIFPKSLWNPQKSRNHLYESYLSILPQLKKYGANKYGLYFERLINYEKADGSFVNQLEHIIGNWNNDVHRKSGLQAVIFDPKKDHTHQRQRGFPCLQQISFVPTENNGLEVVGFYPTQLIYEKAYGNYLGLCMLGRFMATAMGLQLRKFTNITTNPQLKTKINKSDLNKLFTQLNDFLT